MAATKVMVAPNSPRALAKPSTAPAASPGAASGTVTVKKRTNGPAPSVRATSSTSRSMASIDSRIGRTIKGKAMIAAARAAPVQRKAKTMPTCSNAAPMTPRWPNSTNRA